MDKIVESLSPIEKKIIPYLNLSLEEIEKKSGLDKISVLRALQFLENKNFLKLTQNRKRIINFGVNGIYYKKNHLPERSLLLVVSEKNHMSFEEARKEAKLSENEFKVAIGVLKKRGLIGLTNGKLSISVPREELIKKFPEEIFLDKLPILEEEIESSDREAFEHLKTRKEIIEIQEDKKIDFQLTPLGKKYAGKKIEIDLVEEITPEIIKLGLRGKKLRRYDIFANVPKINGGKKHFVNQSINSGRKIWLEMGFKEMDGKYTETSFWNFDALFTAQDHPVRDMHDTFFVKKIRGKLPKKELVEKIKKAHEIGVQGSSGWGYKWQENEAKKVVLRTHTTCLSARKLSEIKKEDFPLKFFSIGKVFRNETLDWSHGFEFNQSEGIVIDENANFRQLIGYLKEFAKKMGYDKIRIQPAYFPYTEPSVEGAVWNEEKKEWVEVLAAGIFRPEVTFPLLGVHYPVLAWGPGFDRLMMKAHSSSDLRELYKNDIEKLRSKKVVL